MTGNVVVTQGTNVMRGERMVVDLDDRAWRASKSGRERRPARTLSASRALMPIGLAASAAAARLRSPQARRRPMRQLQQARAISRAA